MGILHLPLMEIGIKREKKITVPETYQIHFKVINAKGHIGSDKMTIVINRLCAVLSHSASWICRFSYGTIPQFI